jgi:hypothetical protein
MEIKDLEGWEKGLANNTDPYGRRCYTYAAAWADLMESRMASGERLEDIAKETSHEADTDGITGFMYGAAVSILSGVWEHGEQLRRWHNLDLQRGHEGERANKVAGRILQNSAYGNILSLNRTFSAGYFLYRTGCRKIPKWY